MIRRLLLASAVVASPVVVGCSASSSDAADDAPSEDDIKTANCPATFELKLAKPSIYKNTPTKYYDGSRLADSEKERLAAAMTKARTFKNIDLSFKLDKKKSGRCSYVSALSTAPDAPRAELRGTTKPLIDVRFGDYHYYAFPKAYAATGFTFDAGARAGVFAQVSASGAFSDGASLIVKIGSSAITSAAPPPAPGDDPIGKAVDELESEGVLSGPGRNDFYHVTGSTPLDMVKSYIAEKYADDTDIRDEYTYKENATTFSADETVAGTLTKEVALSEAIASVKDWYQDSDEPAGRARLDKVRSLLTAMSAAGATFGFDGFEQNACAAPTTFLLVLDSQKKIAYGIDLNPCEE